jgi:hypothetical protein
MVVQWVRLGLQCAWQDQETRTRVHRCESIEVGRPDMTKPQKESDGLLLPLGKPSSNVSVCVTRQRSRGRSISHCSTGHGQVREPPKPEPKREPPRLDKTHNSAMAAVGIKHFMIMADMVGSAVTSNGKIVSNIWTTCIDCLPDLLLSTNKRPGFSSLLNIISASAHLTLAQNRTSLS